MNFPNTAAVYGIFGSLGGGKTLTAVDISLQFIKNFNFVVTNIKLKNLNPRQEKYYLYIDDISKVEWFKLPIGSLRGSGGRKRVAVVLDELPELLDQYQSGKEYWVKVFLSWLRMTSKNGQFVFVITQHPSFILKPVRLLCAYWIKCEALNRIIISIVDAARYKVLQKGNAQLEKRKTKLSHVFTLDPIGTKKTDRL